MLVPHRFPGAPIEAVLVSRPNRFLLLCKVGRRTVEAHVPDRGRCLDLLLPGQPLILVAASGPLRRTAFTALLARARSAPQTWVSLDPARAPRLVEEALRLEMLPSLAGLRVVRREILVSLRRQKLAGRIDLLLGAATGALLSEPGLDGGGLLCEVKSVGAAREGVALFPDAPTLRGVRHLRLLSALARRGTPCAVVFCAQRGDVRAIAPDEEIDPDFARALRRALRAGVRIAGLCVRALPEGMHLVGEVPVIL